MPTTFLTAEWRNLLMANYAVDPAILRPYLPYGTELDDWQGTHYVSMVGFLFEHTRVRGFSVPWHRHFEEVNLRFYVRHRDPTHGWRRGVVFVKEIVPRAMIAAVANTFYGEKYLALPMRHRWQMDGAGPGEMEYGWRIDGEWNHLRAAVESVAVPIAAGSEAEFITEHYWGYTRLGERRTGQYEVVHPRWNAHQVLDYQLHCRVARLYGEVFVEPLREAPRSVFMANGSAVKVMGGERIGY
ncbi:YqjF family protein [Hymenobacter sp. B81]|uniref:YqjF family protein n=1 Tax=Hymenobacter sp. B81 TaxID=3344878 RepID=UPI0037DC1519